MDQIGLAIDHPDENQQNASVLDDEQTARIIFSVGVASAQPPAIIGYPFGMKSRATLKAPQPQILRSPG